MNSIATAALVFLLAVGAAFGAWRSGAFGPHYAEVVRATPVTVQEPLYADVVDVVPVSSPRPQPGAAGAAGAMAYDVAYRVGDRVRSTRLPEEPGDQIRVGERQRVIGYDVSWRFRDRSGVVRMNNRPGKRLPVVDGAIVEARRSGLRAG